MLLLNPSLVYSFKREQLTHSLFVDLVDGNMEFWIESKSSDRVVEVSHKVYSWDEAVLLLESFHWTDYEMAKMNNVYFDIIYEAKARTAGIRKTRNYNAQQRLLELLKRLERNETVIMDNVIEEFRVGRHQIQRDMKSINEFLEDSNRSVDYVRSKKGYDLNVTGDYFTIDDALIVLLMLYGTRALNKEELKNLSDKMIGLFSQVEQIKIKEFFRSYLFHYTPVQEKNLLHLFSICFQAISQRKVIKFSYTNNRGETKLREVEPLTITYHDRKFYFIGRLKGSAYQDPISFQMDRMGDCIVTKQKVLSSIPDVKVGEYLHKAFYMHRGEPQKVKLKVRDTNIDYLKRNSPNVFLQLSEENHWYTAELEVLGLDGITLWILQQGQHVKVLEPTELHEKVKSIIGEMHQMYFEESVTSS
jgi:predicted DNA-binding transcriptional regulator YafY